MSLRPHDSPRASGSGSGAPAVYRSDDRGGERERDDRAYPARRGREYDVDRRGYGGYEYDGREGERRGAYRPAGGAYGDRWSDRGYERGYERDRADRVGHGDRYRREYATDRSRYREDYRSRRERDPYPPRRRSRSPPSRGSRSPPRREERRGEERGGAKAKDLAQAEVRPAKDPARGKGKGKSEASTSEPGQEAEEAQEDGNDALAAMLGITGFGTTKGKHIEGQLEGAKVKKEHTWRQYMNRKGGFNRVLDKI